MLYGDHWVCVAARTHLGGKAAQRPERLGFPMTRRLRSNDGGFLGSRYRVRVRGAENWTCSGDFCMSKFCIYATSNGSKHREVLFVTDDEAEAERMASLFNELRRHHNEKYTIEKHKNDRNE